MKNIIFTTLILLTHNYILAQQLNLEWVNTFTSNEVNTNFNGISSIHQSNDGTTYITGGFGNTMDFDPGPDELIYAVGGSLDLFIQKINPIGEIVWTKIISNTDFVFGKCIKTDTEGNIYIAGAGQNSGADSIDFDPNQGVYYTPTPFVTFLLKLDENGNFIWVKETPYQVYNFQIYNNTITLSGFFDGTIDADPGVGTHFATSNGNSDVFLQQLNTDGELNWIKTFGGSNAESETFSTQNQNGDNYVTGMFFSQTIDLDPSSNSQIETLIGESDIYISKLSNSGDLIWAKTIGSDQIDSVFFVKANQFDEVYISGNFSGTMDFDPNAGVHSKTAVGTDGFLLKLNSNGEFMWVKTFESNGVSIGASIKYIDFDESNNLFATTFCYGNLDIDPGNGVFYSNNNSSFLLKLSNEGDFLWAQSLPGLGYLVSTTSHYDILVSGVTEGLTDFDFSATNQVEIDAATMIYLAKYSNVNDPCADFGLTFSEFQNISCTGNGMAEVQVINGTAPYIFSWNSTPTNFTQQAIFESAGTYSITYSDATNCEKQTTFHIDGPSEISQFDLNANLIPGVFRSGFPTLATINAFNDGCIPTSGQIKLKVDPFLQLNSASIQPDLISGDTLIWNFSNITYDSPHFNSIISFTVSQQAQIGDSIRLELFITPTENDFDTLNNSKVYVRPVINGYDPNDIQISPQGSCSELFVDKDQKLTYTIRFQNTGNAEAVNIHVLNHLDPNLDINSFRIIGKSFEGLYAEIKPNNWIDFKMDSIMLPDSLSNEPGSQGYIIYEIKAISGTQNNTIISNRAEIYFDFNPAVITNMVTNTLIDEIPTCLESPVGLQEQISAKTGIKVFPNPSSDLWHIEASSSCEWTLYSCLGQVLQTGKSIEKNFEIDASNLKSGVYLLKTEFGTYQLFKN